MTFSAAQCARAEIGVILPVDGYILGGEYSFPIGKLHPFLDLVYDFKNSLPLYRLGGKYELSDQVLNLNYGHWLNLNIPDFGYQKGIEASLVSDHGNDGYYKLAVFEGGVDNTDGHKWEDDFTETSYLYFKFIKSPYLQGTTQVKFDGDVTLGKVSGEDNLYYVVNLKLPVKFNYFKIYPSLGYIKQTDALKPHYDLTYFVRGMEYKSRTGTRLASLTLEEQFPLFGKSETILKYLYGSVFADTGDVFDDFSGFKLRSDVGVGLVINVGIGLVRLDETLSDEGKTRFVLSTQTAF